MVKKYSGIWNTNLDQVMCGDNSVTLPTNEQMEERWKLMHFFNKYKNDSQDQIICPSPYFAMYWLRRFKKKKKRFKKLAEDFFGPQDIKSIYLCELTSEILFLSKRNPT